MRFSDKFLAALMRADKPAYRLAARVGTSPSWLSKALHGAVRVAPGDHRLLEIGRLLGLDADEAFEKDSMNAAVECVTKNEGVSNG